MKLTRQLLQYPKTSVKLAKSLNEKEITIQAPWGKLRGLTWGDESHPPVLLSPGRMDTCSGFRPLVQLLPSCFHYVTVDLPGNGRSDGFPRGAQLTISDYVPTLKVIRDHYAWDNFMYIAHSAGTVMGKLFNIAYPGHMTRVVEIDPYPAHLSYSADPEGLSRWYHRFYHSYYEKYAKLNGNSEPPKYTYDKALQVLMKSRGLHKEAAEHVLERMLEPVGDDLYKFAYDQRFKTYAFLPLSGEAYRTLYTSILIPTLTILAQDTIDIGEYDQTPFVKDPACWQGNYSVKIVKGNHDVHIGHPERMAEDISAFMMTDVEANEEDEVRAIRQG